jgi:hypothetical protein
VAENRRPGSTKVDMALVAWRLRAVRVLMIGDMIKGEWYLSETSFCELLYFPYKTTVRIFRNNYGKL